LGATAGPALTRVGEHIPSDPRDRSRGVASVLEASLPTPRPDRWLALLAPRPLSEALGAYGRDK